MLNIPDHCLGKEVVLDATPSNSGNGNIEEIVWTYGDGFFAEGVTNNYTYAAEGDFVITLKIEDEKGCRDTLQDTVTVLGLPQVSIVKENLCAGDSSFFAVELPANSNFHISQINWDFGDGTTLNGDTTPTHFYNATGDYDIEVVATSDSGCVVTETETISVYSAPYAKFSVDTVCLGDLSKFISQSLPPAGSFIASWEYQFEDGTIGNGSNFNHVFDSSGVFSVKHIVETNNGCRDTVEQITKVYDVPVLEFSVGSVEGCAPYCATFESDITVENAEVTYTEWDFGNGNISTDTNPTFCFEDEGDFSMSLTVQNSLGCSVTKTKDSFVKVHPSPSAGFIIDWTTVTETNPTINMINTALFSDRIEWTFGDGTVSSSVGDMSHTYSSLGSFEVQQVVENEFGCTDTAKRLVSVRPETAVFIPNAFTPDVSIGLNDSFYPVVSGTLREAKFNMWIYDRWGVEVFHTENLDEHWDGTFSGKMVQEDVYVYKITFLPAGYDEDDYIMYKGHVNVIK